MQVQKKNNKYMIDGRVRFSEIDHTRKMTVPAIINYFQDCSTFQSEDLGIGLEFLEEKKKAWILTYWQVVIERYPKMNEKLQVSTWASKFKGMLADRNFCMTDADGKRLAYAQSVWVYMDMEKGRPVRPEQDEVDAYGQCEPLDMDYEPRKIILPETAVSLEPFPVRRYHIDTNEHVNNCQYVQMAMEMLNQEKIIRQVRVEYKKSAVFGDVILPRVGEREDRTIVELCATDGDLYATVEFAWQ